MTSLHQAAKEAAETLDSILEITQEHHHTRGADSKLYEVGTYARLALASLSAALDKPAVEPADEVLRAISQALASMMASRTELVDGMGNVHGYQIKTGALHRILGHLSAAGHPVIITRTANVSVSLPGAALSSPPGAPAPGWRLVPEEPTPEMWGGLARDLVMWMQMTEGAHHGSKLHKHLRNLGREIPDWLAKEIPDADSTPPKGTIAACIYKAMLADSPTVPAPKEMPNG